MFGRGKRGVRVVAYLGDEQASDLQRELASGGFAQTHAALETATAVDRAMLTQLLAEEHTGKLVELDRWTDAFPRSAIPLTFRGAYHVILGWRARGEGRGHTVSERGWRRFTEHLEQAETDLYKAAEMEPPDPTPWSFLVLSGRGLEVGTEEILRRWEAVEARCPRHRYAANHVLQGLAEKWGGSHQEMFAFARAQSGAAPAGDPIHTLVAEAHLERWLYFGFDDDPDGQGAYLRGSAVREEMRAAANRSVASPDWAGYRWEVMDRNYFAMALGLGGDPAACEQFAALDGAVADHPWAYLGNPAKAYDRVRREVCR